MKAVLCWVVFFSEKRAGIKLLSDFFKHVSYGNSPYFCALAAFAPLAHSARRGGEAFRYGSFPKYRDPNTDPLNTVILFHGARNFGKLPYLTSHPDLHTGPRTLLPVLR